MPGQNKYGARHKQLRKWWERQVAHGRVCCARGEDCLLKDRPQGSLILPGEPWDLDHDDTDRRKYLGPSHRRCNRATLTHAKRRAAEAARGGFQW